MDHPATKATRFLSEKFRSEQFRFCALMLFLLSLSKLEITRGEPSCRPISTIQSNTWNMASASRAIDNDTSTCSVSGEYDYSPSFGWWQMDLGSVFTVYSVTVTSGYDSSHTGSWPYYVQNFSISVGMTNSTEIVNSDICYYYNEVCFLKAGIASTFVCSPNPLRGRYVTLKRRGGYRQDAISLCEVSVQCDQPPSSSSTSAPYISSVFSSQLSSTSGYSTTETTHVPSTSLEASAIAAIVLGSGLLLCLIINVVLIIRLTQLKRMLQNQQDPYTVPKRETNDEQPNQYATLSNSQRDSIFPAAGAGNNIYRNAYELDDR